MPLTAQLVHAPKLRDDFGPLGPSSSVNCMAVGLPALGGVLADAGHDVELVHLGVEQAEDPDFEVARHCADRGVDLVGLSLHWHPQTWESIQSARAIKAANPGAFLVLGGFTASLFHDEILAAVPEIDGVIRGDGERPLALLAEALDRGGPLADVPNLTWRAPEGLRDNPLSYAADGATLSRLPYERLDLLRHRDRYIRDWCGPHYLPHGRRARWVMRGAQHLFGSSRRYFVLPVGRGCVFDCSWCGGGRTAHGLHSGRKRYVRASSERVAELIGQAMDLGFRGVHACFDPTPDDPRYWLRVFERVRSAGLRPEILFESYRLPHPDLVQGLAETFRRPTIAVSPDSADEDVRKKARGMFLSNDALLETVRTCDAAGVDLVLFFTSNLPWEADDGGRRARELAVACQAAAKRIRVGIRAFSIELEPGSPWSQDPGRFGIELGRTAFVDYLEAHRPGAEGPETGLGFTVIGQGHAAPAEPRFAQPCRETCQDLCPLPPNPRWGPVTCSLLRKVVHPG